MPRRLTVALFLLLAMGLLVATPAQRPPVAVAQPAETPGLAVIRATYDILLDQFYRPLEPAELLNAAWDGLTTAANQMNLRPPAPLPPLPPERGAAFDQFAVAYAAYLDRLGRNVNTTNVAFTAASAMARSLNEGHTIFLPPASYRAFLASLSGGRVSVGLGVRLSSRPPWYVTEVAPDSPAARAGILPGDVLVAANGRELGRIGNQQVAQALAGAEDTNVTLTIDRGELLDIVVTRGRFYFPPLSSRLLADGVGYLRLETFVVSGVALPNGTELQSEVDRHLDGFDRAGVRGLILDLRGNGGGSVFTASELLGRFLPENALTVVRSDQRGHVSNGIVGGRMRRIQYPMVVLVDGGSGSSSEVTASTLGETGRALLVGERTSGILATAQLFPVGEDAGLYVAIAEQVTNRSMFRIDEQGVPVDLEVRDTRTVEDYRAGRDPQLEAALTALAEAPAPPGFRSIVSPLSADQIRAMLERYFPAAAQIPTNERLTRVVAGANFTFTHPNQWMNAAALGARDPIALQGTIRSRGWLGSYGRAFDATGVPLPTVGIGVDLYESETGAAAAVAADDFPDIQDVIPTVVELGDQSISYRGVWLSTGQVWTTWRRGRVVFTVSYGDVPGFERTDVLIEVARLVDSLYLQNPLPAMAPRMPSAAAQR